MAPPRKDGRPPNHWPTIIARAAVLAGGFSHPPSLRRLFYLLVAEGTLPNTHGDYDGLAKRTAQARRYEGGWDRYLPNGYFPELDDQTREVVVDPGWDSAIAVVNASADQFRMDRDRNLDRTVILGVEKRGIFPYLTDWFGELGFPLVALGGYHSVPFEKQLRRHITREGRDAVVLFAGDHDASGDDLYRNLVRRVGGRTVEFRRIALTFDQVEEMGLPSWGGKEDDSRWPAFAERHGYDPYGEPVQVELDAVDLDVLRDLYATEIADVVGLPVSPGVAPTFADFQEFAPFAEALEEEEEERETLRRLEAHWDAVVDYLEDLEAS